VWAVREVLAGRAASAVWVAREALAALEGWAASAAQAVREA
jgi:hypothetical protein